MKSRSPEHLADIEEIKQLKARYFRHVDTKDWEAWRLLFTADATTDLDGTLRAPSELVDATRDFLATAVSVHRGFMPEIEITAPDTAHGIWAMEDYIAFPADGDAAPRGMRGYGHYREEYRRIGGQWLIASITLTRLRVDALGTHVPGA